MDSTEALKARVVELKKKGYSPVSINTYLRHIKTFFRWQGRPWELPWLKEEQKILPILTVAQVEAIIRFRPQGTNQVRAHLLMLVLLDTGLRADEALSLTKQDINLDLCTFKVKGKGNKERVVPFSTDLRKVMFKHVKGNVKETDYIFGTRKGTKITQRNALRDVKAIGKRLGITGVRFSFHTLRHSFAVTYLRRGGNLEFLRRILGHSSILTTQRYLRSLGVEDLTKVHGGLTPLNGK